ncbi:ArsA family ATPase [Actinacidiphila bryophytorum]|uniref:Arsenical pump-driving ATPase n=1 Tax=Actinacidiphila bryophytorum TaxID=1436133 RepID=A0A9W4H048_9ACTN|nr:ArsA-related P-loop ATPase [Actinacidiphila bryophytorum]MBM9436298.1 ArsA family ATPase [Actinacidiphila bryophytorum]MBN6543565.1 ArsA family ATPase [Actinacidiphila bryophytorum]CAG7632022.1 Arsenical pump-driving ATPase [Actinacidiphila bryophytorum]
MPAAPVRTLLITGAGGAGRTAVAAATAAAAARAGTRTLLLTYDRGAAAALAGAVPGLGVASVDPGAAFQDALLDLQSRGGTLLALLGAAPLDPEELTPLPGAEALALLRAVRAAHDGTWELAVVDLPPVREAVALLALPEQLRRYLGRLLPADRQAARALRPVLAQLAGVPMPTEWAYEAAARADRELAAVQAVVHDPGTSVAVVVEPGAHAADVVRTARTGLALHGLAPAALVANRLLPTGSADPFLAALSGAQQDHLKALADICAADGAALHELPHLGREPQLPEEALAVPHEALPAAAGGDPWSVEDRLRDEGHFVWSLPLPGAAKDGLDLVRRGDELVVDAGGFRRILPLPSALRRCTVEGAALRDGALRVRFTPDPGLWPR